MTRHPHPPPYRPLTETEKAIARDGIAAARARLNGPAVAK